MNNRITIFILLCLAMLACGQAAAQGTFGTKVNAGDPDVGLPLSTFAAPTLPTQVLSWISYWDINANGLFDDQDVPYLQFSSTNVPPGLRFVRSNDIRLAGNGIYPAGSYVKPGDSDIGKPLVTSPPEAPLPSSVPPTVSYYYLDVDGSTGYDLGDPVYLKVLSTTLAVNGVGTNDIRITANAGFPAGSRVSLNDPDAGKPLTLFKLILPFPAIQAAGGPTVSSVAVPAIAALNFFNANGNTMPLPGGPAIYDDGDVVYFDVNPIGFVSPNDIRLY
jgi:hypothetical protein